QIKIPSLKAAPGWYKIEAVAKDKTGDTIRDTRYVEIYDTSTVSPTIFAEISVDPTSLREDTKAARYRLITNLDSLFVIRDIGNDEEKSSRSFLSFSGKSPYYELAKPAKDKDGTPVSFVFVKYNRLFTESRNIIIPDSSGILDIGYETYRDKTLPGSTEKWKIKISGYKRDKIASEVLTGMYDASLDQFAPHRFRLPVLQGKQLYNQGWQGSSFQASSGMVKPEEREWRHFTKTYDELIASSLLQGLNNGIRGGGQLTPGVELNKMAMAKPGAVQEVTVRGYASQAKREVSQENDAAAPPVADSTGANTGGRTTEPAPPSIRTNLQETAFFFPDLKTDSAGNLEFSFTMPEALTRWKWMTLAHTKDLAFGYSEKTVVTQKDLMVQPNATRFVRQGDRFDFSGKIANLTDKELTGQVELQLIDPTTNTPVDGWFQNVFPNQFFTAPAKQSVAVTFSIEIPFIYNKPLTYRLIARSGNMSDGEEGTLPVLSNRILVTESIQLPVRGTGTRKFSFEKLLKSGESETLHNHSLTVEYTSNPAWYAVQALPWLADFPRESADQAFNQFYAYTLASKIANASPKLRELFKKWNTTDTAKMLSNLEKNEELKSVLLAETPWVMEAQTESAR
ncbi:MAG: alpha-2-macroglobulin, partial [Sphingobacteriales bacterium]